MDACANPEADRAKVLVVDDDAIVCRCVTRILAARHDVSTVDDARAALELIRSGARFDAILCDLMMPNMTGAELYAELLRAVPDQASRFALLTGGAFSASADARMEAFRGPVIEKPFTRDDLLDCVQCLRATVQ